MPIDSVFAVRWGPILSSIHKQNSQKKCFASWTTVQPQRGAGPKARCCNNHICFIWIWVLGPRTWLSKLLDLLLLNSCTAKRCLFLFSSVPHTHSLSHPASHPFPELLTRHHQSEESKVFSSVPGSVLWRQQPNQPGQSSHLFSEKEGRWRPSAYLVYYCLGGGT